MDLIPGWVLVLGAEACRLLVGVRSRVRVAVAVTGTDDTVAWMRCFSAERFRILR